MHQPVSNARSNVKIKMSKYLVVVS